MDSNSIMRSTILMQKRQDVVAAIARAVAKNTTTMRDIELAVKAAQQRVAEVIATALVERFDHPEEVLGDISRHVLELRSRPQYGFKLVAKTDGEVTK